MSKCYQSHTKSKHGAQSARFRESNRCQLENDGILNGTFDLKDFVFMLHFNYLNAVFPCSIPPLAPFFFNISAKTRSFRCRFDMGSQAI